MPDFQMKRIFSVLMALAATLPATSASSQESLQQALDQVQQVLKEVEQKSGARIHVPPMKNSASSSNPFYGSGTRGQQGQQTPSVDLGPNSIRIEVGGKTIVVPRTGSASGKPLQNLAGPIDTEKVMAQARAYEQFAQAASLFKQNQFARSESLMLQAYEQLEKHPVIAQHLALVLFQNGKYEQASVLAYEALRNQAAFDWKTLQNLYGDTRFYGKAYSQLQAKVREKPNQPARRFLLGYHHLMLGHSTHALAEFKQLEPNLANDPVLRQLTTQAQRHSAAPPRPDR